MTEKRFQIDVDFDITEFENQKVIESFEYGNGRDWEDICKRLNELSDKITEQAIQIDFLKDENKHMRQVLKENRQLKQFPIKLDNRIQKLQEDLQKLSEMDKTDLNPQAVEDIATVIGISLNALLEFKKEILND